MRNLLRKISQKLYAAYSFKFIRILIPIGVMPVHVIILWVFSSFLAVSVMSTYDFLIRSHFKLELDWKTTFRYAWIANSFNNMMGLAGLTGVGMRTFLYKKRGIQITTAGAASLFLSPILMVGLALFGCFVLMGVFPVDAVFERHSWLQIGVMGISLYLPFFLLMQRSSLFAKWFNKGQGKLPWNVVIASLASSLLEWACAGILFWLFAFHEQPQLSFAPVFGVYIVAAIAGIISMAPGGIGAFDLIALYGLQTLEVNSSAAFIILILFRLFYFIAPCLLGLFMAAFEISLVRKLLKGMIAAISNARRLTYNKLHKPSRWVLLGKLGAWLIEKMLLVNGILLLLSLAMPKRFAKSYDYENILFIPILHHSGELLSISVGIMLIIVSRGALLRTRRAYIWAIVLWSAGLFIKFSHGIDMLMASILLLLTLIWYTAHIHFTRKSATISPLTIWIGVPVSCVWLLSYLAMDINADLAVVGPLHDLASSKGEYMMNLIGGFSGVLILAASMFTLRPHHYTGERPSEKDIEKLTQFISKEDGNVLTHLLYLGDKHFYWAQHDQVLIPYSRIRRKLIVLGDPIGSKKLVGAAIQEFQSFAQRFGLTVVFYQATPDYLPIYHENGYKFFKLGEEALVPLEPFSLSGKKNQNLRTALNRSNRMNQRFEVLTPPYHPELLAELRDLSDEWLGNRKEKAYSLGWFNEAYIQRSPLTLLRDAEGKILAFATLAPAYNQKKVISIDLMRHVNHAPNGTMDVLLIRLMEWTKEQGYAYFNLGMSPLSSVGVTPYAHREEKLARLVFKYGGRWYGFIGLRRYKEKFIPEWQPRFLAYPANKRLPFVTMDLVRLISRTPE
ncbi:bifunctional lysylphosphatidylglycerol flippase/synthetase MprF [Paenibacillus sp. JJ-223]|uniref:bifunctional lysylphosphatidylglycerol flippase/synthetase MprF n=1 Tax=Paenibacillus sp. JJ-223 TaxID=2905647 RepID=UPI001F3AE821|nr:bifunctional lysylphosphatidylglycerol flippase/synthetase MprF [Paenibacillus sp. JJ-223]CAH1191123.1 Phosphatidylglycerol lysyltransferase [Paenibacillus sp. JJ-223]